MAGIGGAPNPIKAPCAWCVEANRLAGTPAKDVTRAVTRVPHALFEWACQAHTEAFWRGAVQTAGALVTLRRLEDEDEEMNAAEIDERMEELYTIVELAPPCPRGRNGTDLAEGIPVSNIE